jgi:solute carrier family 9 (sodium/hydrogen exchanger), member 8
MAEDDAVIDRQAAAVTATAVFIILVCTVGGNLLQRLNNAYWFSSDSIFAIVLGILASIPLCGGGGVGLDVAFETVFFLYLVPPILFESGYALSHKDFFRNFTAILLFSVLGTIISALVMGFGLFYLARGGYFVGLDVDSPKEALLFGSLMSATDPVATLAVLGSLGVEPQLYALVFGESVLNDAVAIVLFQTFNSLPEGTSVHLSPAEATGALGHFLGIGIGSVVFGVSFGVLTALITKHMVHKPHAHSEVTIVLSVAYLSFITADFAGLSGLMAVFFAGIVSSHYAKYNISADGQHTTHNVARTLAYVSETLVFVYFGYLTLPIFFPACTVDRNDAVGIPYTVSWDFVGWTVAMCFVSRALNVFPLALLVNLCKRTPRQARTCIAVCSMLMK